MTDSTRPEDTARLPEVSPDELGNTIDGSVAGDGAFTHRSDEADSAAEPDRISGGATRGHPGGTSSTSAATGTDERHAARREEQKKVYRSPKQPDHAVGGSDGTTDGQ